MPVKAGSLLTNECCEPFRAQYTPIRKASVTVFGQKPSNEKTILVAGCWCDPNNLRQVTFEIVNQFIEFGRQI